MPHNHKRRRTEKDTSFDLPPTSIARPLPAFRKETRGTDKKPATGKRKSTRAQNAPSKSNDDTPRAFARLLNFQRTGKGLPNALDDGPSHKGKKLKPKPENSGDTTMNAKISTNALPDTTTTTNAPDLKILPGERLGDFSARVDHALPIAGVRSKGQSSSAKIPGLKAEERQTKHNRRLQRMQKQWREEEAKRKEKREEELEDDEEEREEQQHMWEAVRGQGRKKRRRSEREDEDPWAELEKRKQESRQKNLQDVVQAPPQLGKIKARFKDYAGLGFDAGSVPGSVGSLRKREQVARLRSQVIVEYRKRTGRTD